jgi:hypothetical protein
MASWESIHPSLEDNTSRLGSTSSCALYMWFGHFLICIDGCIIWSSLFLEPNRYIFLGTFMVLRVLSLWMNVVNL